MICVRPIAMLPWLFCGILLIFVDTAFADAQTCGVQTNSKLLGGIHTSLGEFPWTVLLQYQKPNGRGFYCGGTLINDKYILTAAHCISGAPKDYDLIGVRLGEHDITTATDCEGGSTNSCSDPPIDVTIAEKIVHKDYENGKQLYDIALLKLSKSVTFSSFIQPICLPSSEDFLNNPTDGQQMTVAGWGGTKSESKLSDVKLKFEVPIVATKECQDAYSRLKVQINDTQLCAGGSGSEGFCKGDGGSGLMAFNNNRWYIAGIVSFGPSTCGTQFPNVYTKVAAYSDWIKENTAN